MQTSAVRDSQQRNLPWVQALIGAGAWTRGRMTDPAGGVADLIARIGWLPAWAQSLLLFAVALGLHARGVVLVRRVLRRDTFWRSLVLRTQGPGRLTLITLALSAAIQ